MAVSAWPSGSCVLEIWGPLSHPHDRSFEREGLIGGLGQPGAPIVWAHDSVFLRMEGPGWAAMGMWRAEVGPGLFPLAKPMLRWLG